MKYPLTSYGLHRFQEMQSYIGDYFQQTVAITLATDYLKSYVPVDFVFYAPYGEDATCSSFKESTIRDSIVVSYENKPLHSTSVLGRVFKEKKELEAMEQAPRVYSEWVHKTHTYSLPLVGSFEMGYKIAQDNNEYVCIPVIHNYAQLYNRYRTQAGEYVKKFDSFTEMLASKYPTNRLITVNCGGCECPFSESFWQYGKSELSYDMLAPFALSLYRKMHADRLTISNTPHGNLHIRVNKDSTSAW